MSVPLASRAPTPTPHAGGPRVEAQLSDGDFHRLARLAKAEFGLHLEPTKRSLIRARLTRRLRDLRLTSFSTYIDQLEADPAADRERLISALTTNVTNFFRETHHFETLERDVLPDLATRARAGGRVRLWSAGCSTGQEPYSIAGSLLHVAPDAGRWDVKLLATDIDGDVLAKAEAGRYGEEDRTCPDPSWHDRLFDGAQTEEPRPVRPEVRALATFRRLNLNGPWPITGRFDAIFCRNVAIYFDKETQARLWSRFAAALNPGGWLFIGHSERIVGPPLAQLATAGVTTYRKHG